MKRSLRLLALAALVSAAGAVAIPRDAGATVVIQPSLEDMTRKSGIIVRATVEEQTVTLGEEGKRILTLTRFKVTESLKGTAKAGDTVTLYQVGGTYGGKVARIIGMSEFTAGEEVVLFGSTFLATDTVRYLQDNRKAEVPAATLNPTGGWMVQFGIGLGKFQVTPGAHGPMASEQLGDVATVTRVGDRSVIGSPVTRVQQPLPVFLSEVRRMVAEGRTP